MTLEELAQAMMGSQADITAANPYYRLQAVPEAITGKAVQLVSQDPTRFKARDALAWGLGSGLISGLLGGIGDTYQDTLKGRYNQQLANAMIGDSTRVADLPQGLFDKATSLGNMFALSRGEEARKLQQQQNIVDLKNKNDILMEMGKLAGTDPAAYMRAKPIYEAILAQTGAKSAPVASPVTQQQSAAAEAATPEAPLSARTGLLPDIQIQKNTDELEGLGSEGALGKDYLRLRNKFMAAGDTPAQAGISARDMLSQKKEALGRQYKRVEDAQTKAVEMQQLADESQMALDKVGYTGIGGGAAQVASKALGLIPILGEGQHEKATAGDLFETLAAKMVATVGRAFKGPMSDRDVKLMLAQGIQLGNNPETNQIIVDKMNYIANLQRAYVDFMNEMQDQGRSARDAEREWDKFKAANPYAVKGADGQLIPNPAWIDGSAQGAATSTIGNTKLPSNPSGIPSEIGGKKVIKIERIG